MRFVSYVLSTLFLILGAVSFCQAQSPVLQPLSGDAPNPKDVKHVLAGRSCQDMGVALTLPGYAVISGGNQRQALKIGDLLGVEAYKVVAVQDEQIFLETPAGFALLEPASNGKTQFRQVRTAEIPLDVRNALAVATRD